jgi:hypothetical protein
VVLDLSEAARAAADAYKADAISGVVNVVMKRDITGYRTGKPSRTRKRQKP